MPWQQSSSRVVKRPTAQKIFGPPSPGGSNPELQRIAAALSDQIGSNTCQADGGHGEKEVLAQPNTRA